MAFTIEDDFDDNDIEIKNGEVEAEVSAESFQRFVSGDSEATDDVVLDLHGKDEKERVAEINNFVLSKIVTAITNGHKLPWVLKHSAKCLDWLAHQAELTLNDSDNNALGLYKKAKQFYALKEIEALATAVNETYNCEVKASILDFDKPRFTSRLFHAIAEETTKTAPSLKFEYKAGRKTEEISYDDAFGLKVISALKSERAKIVKAAKSAGRDYTEQESARLTEISANIVEAWQEFFSGAKDIVANSNDFFPENVGTGRTTTSAVYRGVCTMDSINFGAFQL